MNDFIDQLYQTAESYNVAVMSKQLVVYQKCCNRLARRIGDHLDQAFLMCEDHQNAQSRQIFNNEMLRIIQGLTHQQLNLSRINHNGQRRWVKQLQSLTQSWFSQLTNYIQGGKFNAPHH